MKATEFSEITQHTRP